MPPDDAPEDAPEDAPGGAAEEAEQQVSACPQLAKAKPACTANVRADDDELSQQQCVKGDPTLTRS